MTAPPPPLHFLQSIAQMTTTTNPAPPTHLHIVTPTTPAAPAAAGPGTGTQAAAAPSSTPAGSESRLKKFTYAQISDKVSKRRSSVPEYEQLLLSCRVRSDAEGAVFDSGSGAWATLLHLCAKADALQREETARANRVGDTPNTIVVHSRDFPLPGQTQVQAQAQQGQSTAAGTAPAHAPSSASNSLGVNAPGGGAGAGAGAGGASVPVRRSPHASPRSSAKKKSAHGGSGGGGGSVPVTIAPPPSSSMPDDESGWVNIVRVPKGQSAGAAGAAGAGGMASPSSGAGGGPRQAQQQQQSSNAPQSSSSLSSAASSIFSNTAMSRAASALDKFAKAVTARPVPSQGTASHLTSPGANNNERRIQPNKQGQGSQAPHGSGGGKSSSNSSRDVSLVREDLEFEAMLAREYEAVNAARRAAAAAAAAAAASGPTSASDDLGTTPAAASSDPSASKDAELLAQFVALIAPGAGGGQGPDIGAIKSICKIIGVPHKHRGQLWNVLLGVKQEPLAPLAATGAADAAATAGTAGASGAPATASNRPRLMSLPGQGEGPARADHEDEPDAVVAAAVAATVGSLAEGAEPQLPKIVLQALEPAEAFAATAAPGSATGSRASSPSPISASAPPPSSSSSSAATAPAATPASPTAPGGGAAGAGAGATATSADATSAPSTTVSTPATATAGSGAGAASTSTSTGTGTGAITAPPAFDLHNQRVIQADILRTLPHLRTFQSPAVRHDMEVILTQYCKLKQVSYKQGQNYILSPLFLLNLPGGRDDIFALYERLIARLLPNIFSDNDFGSLQCTFLLLKLALLYHDPELAHWLEENDMGPELFASSWFITLWSNRCKLSVLFYLWDCLILDNNNDPQLSFWVSLALLIQHRAAILAEPIVTLPEFLSKLSITSKKEASVLVNRAKKLYRAASSLTARRQLADLGYSRKIDMDSLDYLLLMQQRVLHVSEEELVRSCYADIKMAGNGVGAGATTGAAGGGGGVGADGSGAPTASSVSSLPPLPLAGGQIPPLKFFILDCRPLEQYEAGHLPCAYHLDPSLLSNPAELAERVESLASMKGCHFCFLGEGGERPATAASIAQNSNGGAGHHGHHGHGHHHGHPHHGHHGGHHGHPANGPGGPPGSAGAAAAAAAAVPLSPAAVSNGVVHALVQVFLKRHFKYLSICRGGYAACHALILASDHSLELVDHNQQECLECTGRRKVNSKEKKGGTTFFQNVRRIAGTLAGKPEAEPADSAEEYEAQHVPDSALILLPSSATGMSGGGAMSTTAAAAAAAAAAGGGAAGASVLSPIHGGTGSPSGSFGVGGSSLSLRLLHTVLRDKNVDVSSFADALQRLTSLLLASFFDRVEVKERAVSTGSGAMFTGIESTPLTTVALHPIAMELLDAAFHPYRPVCKRQCAQYAAVSAHDGNGSAATQARTRAGSPSSASASAAAGVAGAASSSSPIPSSSAPVASSSVMCTWAPPNLLESNILLFFPILTPSDLPALMSVLADLLARSAHPSQLTVLSVLAARPALWAIAHKHPEVLLIATAVDELTPQQRMVPGISSDWEARYHAAH